MDAKLSQVPHRLREGLPSEQGDGVREDVRHGQELRRLYYQGRCREVDAVREAEEGNLTLSLVPFCYSLIKNKLILR